MLPWTWCLLVLQLGLVCKPPLHLGVMLSLGSHPGSAPEHCLWHSVGQGRRRSALLFVQLISLSAIFLSPEVGAGE